MGSDLKNAMGPGGSGEAGGCAESLVRWRRDREEGACRGVCNCPHMIWTTKATLSWRFGDRQEWHPSENTLEEDKSHVYRLETGKGRWQKPNPKIIDCFSFEKFARKPSTRKVEMKWREMSYPDVMIKKWNHSCASGIYNLSSASPPSSSAAAKSLQSCPTLCDPIDGSPPGSAVSGILQARTLEWVAISFSDAWKWKVKWSRSVVSDSSQPHGRSPPGSPTHGIVQARVLEWGAIAFSPSSSTRPKFSHQILPRFLIATQNQHKS